MFTLKPINFREVVAPTPFKGTKAVLNRTLNEPDRIRALQRYHIMDSFPDPAFERVTNLAAHLFGVPAAVISLVYVVLG